MQRQMLALLIVSLLWDNLLTAPAGYAGFLDGFKLPAKNYVRNGDFSEGMDAWKFFHAPSGEGFSGVVNEDRNGGPCFKISGSFNESIYFQQPFMPGQSSLEPGETYTLSAWFKAENVAGRDPGKLLNLANYGWHSGSVSLGPSAPTTDGWEGRSLTFKAPPTVFPPDSHKYMLVFYWPKGSHGTVWMDDVQIEKGQAATAFDVRHNDTARMIVEELKRLEEQLARQRKNIAERFAKNPLSSALEEKLSACAVEVQRRGMEMLAYEKLSAARIREIGGQTTTMKGEVGRLTCLVWYKNPYVASDETELPPNLDAPPPRKLLCFANETRNLGLMFSNLSGHSLDYRIAPQRFKREADGMEIDGRDFIGVYEAPLIRGILHKERLFTDPLPPCNAMNGLCVPGGETRQAVVSIRTRDLEPGTYRGIIFLDALHDREALSRSAELELEVLPVRLPDHMPVDVCPLGTHLVRPEEALRLGHNLIPVDGGAIAIYLDAEGNITRDPDWAYLDQQVRACRTVVPECKFELLFSLGPRFVSTTERLYGFHWPQERMQRGWQNWVRAIFSHAKSLGLATGDLYLQVVDEPQDSQVEMMAELSRLAKEAVPGLKTMTYGGDPRRHAALFRYLDLPCPSSAALAGPGLLSAIKALGVNPGIYDCREYNEIIVPLLYRRLMPWKVWKYGLSGWHYWYRDDRHPNWGAVKFMSVLYPLAEDEFGRILTEDIGYVISRHWLAMEAGVQDYKAMVLLKGALDRVRARGGNEALITEASAFVNAAPDRVLALIQPARFPNEMAPGTDPNLVDRIREEASRLTARLLGASGAEWSPQCSLNGEGHLALTSDFPCRFRVRYVVDGRLPFREMQVASAAREHHVVLDRAGGTMINKCKVHVFADDGRFQVVSPLIDGRITVDSVFPDYESTSLTDGIRYAGAQYWPGKTWISQGTPAEHWVRLDWETPREISTVTMCWMTRGGLPDACKVQYLADKSWKDLTPWRRPSSAFDVVSFQPVKTNAIRVVQKAGGGSVSSPNLMGMSEIEVR